MIVLINDEKSFSFERRSHLQEQQRRHLRRMPQHQPGVRAEPRVQHPWGSPAADYHQAQQRCPADDFQLSRVRADAQGPGRGARRPRLRGGLWAAENVHRPHEFRQGLGRRVQPAGRLQHTLLDRAAPAHSADLAGQDAAAARAAALGDDQLPVLSYLHRNGLSFIIHGFILITFLLVSCINGTRQTSLHFWTKTVYSVLCTVQYSVLWCGVVWCSVLWCTVLWCGVVWCGVVCWHALCTFVWCIEVFWSFVLRENMIVSLLTYYSGYPGIWTVSLGRFLHTVSQSQSYTKMNRADHTSRNLKTNLIKHP